MRRLSSFPDYHDLWKVSGLISAFCQLLLLLVFLLHIVFVHMLLCLIKYFDIQPSCFFCLPNARQFSCVLAHLLPSCQYSCCIHACTGNGHNNGKGQLTAVGICATSNVDGRGQQNSCLESSSSSRFEEQVPSMSTLSICPNCDVISAVTRYPALANRTLVKSRSVDETKSMISTLKRRKVWKDGVVRNHLQQQMDDNVSGPCLKNVNDYSVVAACSEKLVCESKLQDSLSAEDIKHEHSSDAFLDGGGKCAVSEEMASPLTRKQEAHEMDGCIDADAEHHKAEDVILDLRNSLEVERETLCSVYTELEEERNAAETAANEAIAMILRLQEEKAALQLEAAHYQRMAEEKAIHDEQAIQLLHDALSRKARENMLLERLLEDMIDRRQASNATGKTSFDSPPMLLLKDKEEVLSLEHEIARNEESPPHDFGERWNAISEEQPHKKLKDSMLQDKVIISSTLVASAGEPAHASHNTGSDLTDILQLFAQLDEKSDAPDDDETKALLNKLRALEEQLEALRNSESTPATSKGSGLDCSNLAANSSETNHELIMNLCATEVPLTNSFSGKEGVKDGVRFSVSECNIHVFHVDERAACGDGMVNPNEESIPTTHDIHEVCEDNQLGNSSSPHESQQEEALHNLLSSARGSVNTAYNMDTQSLKEFLHHTKSVARNNTGNAEEEKKSVLTSAGDNGSIQERHWSAPLVSEDMGIILLKEILQQLQELLKENKKTTDMIYTTPSVESYLKPIPKSHRLNVRKRSHSDGPGQL